MNEVMERPVERQELTQEELDLVTRTVAVGATKDELKLHLHNCRRLGVHPLDNKLYFTKRKMKDGSYKYTPLVSIDFFRELGHATGQCLGVSDPVFSGKPGKEDFTATVTVKRLVHGHVAEFTATARWTEYCPPSGLDFMWQKMKHTMLGKCAEALAWRKGFADAKLNDLHITEEFDLDREPPESLTKVMYQDFPPGELLRGTLLRLVPPQGAEPAGAVIQMANEGLSATYIVYGDEQRYAPLVGCEVEYRYEKKPGAKWILTELYLAPKPAARQAIEVQAPAPLVQDDAEVEEPPIEAYFEAGNDCIGLLTAVQPKQSRDKSKEWHELTLACVNGDFLVKSWKKPSHFDLASFDELLDKQVWFKVSKGAMYKGEVQYMLEFIEEFRKAKADA